MTPLVGVPAIAELMKLPPNNPNVTEWMGRMLWMTALCGGIFGLIGGWLIDRFGRKRILALSIFVYALSPFAAAYSTSLAAFRFLSLHDVRRRVRGIHRGDHLAGGIVPAQSRKSLGLDAGVCLARRRVRDCSRSLDQFAFGASAGLRVPEAFNAHAPWRYILMTGLIAGHSDRAALAVCAGIANLEGETARRNIEATELRGIVRAGIAPDHAGHRGAFSLRLCGGVWRVANHHAQHCSRFARTETATRRNSRRCALKRRN